MPKFKPTHVIFHNDKEIPVRKVDDQNLDGSSDGPLYTKSEWNNATSADWEWSDRFGISFLGQLKDAQIYEIPKERNGKP